MAFGDGFDQFQSLVREHLEPSVEDLRIVAEDPGWEFFQASRNVTRMGRPTGTAAGTPGYEARWNIKIQEGGLLEGADFGETQLVKMGGGDLQIMGALTTSLHGDPTKVPLPSVLELKSFLKKVRGMYTLDFETIESRLLSEPIEDLSADVVSAVIGLMRAQATSLFWGPGNGIVGVVPTGGGTVAEATVLWITVEQSQIFRFVVGQRYVAASLSSGNPATPRAGSETNPGVFRCVGINPFTLKVGLQSEPGQGNISLTAGDGIIINRMWNFTSGTSRACNGVDNLLINSGAFPDTSITDVTDYPMLQANITGDETSTSTYVLPEPEIIDGLLDLMTAFNGEVPPVLCAENNVWTLYNHLERRANMMVAVPQGGTYEGSGGVSGPMYTHAGRPYVIMRSPKVRKNRIYGLTPKAFIRFMPNDFAVRWRNTNGGVAGAANIFRPVYVGAQSTDLFTAEWDSYYQLAVTRPNSCLVHKGVHSKRTYDAL